MERKIIFLLIVLLIVSCITGRNGTIKDIFKAGEVKYTFSIPEGYTKSTERGGDEIWVNYLYKDSILLFVTNSNLTENYNKIRREGVYSKRFEAFHNSTSLILDGKDSLGYYWKERLFEDGITVGYTNVPTYKLEEFDSSILSFVKKK